VKGLLADLNRAKTIYGWFAMEEGELLANLASVVAEDSEIVEIGAYGGRATAFLVAGSRSGNGAHITSIDDWGPAAIPGGTEQAAADQVLVDYQASLVLMEAGALVTPLRARSTQVVSHWLKPIGLLFLDASHTYEDTLRDAVAWSVFVPPGGVAAFHDYHPDHPGVVQALDEFVAQGGWDDVAIAGTLRVIRRGEDRS
jgi:predicted O-methyltransferase YrrM